ncbi:hypothetical protein H6F38_24385 [Paenibacillus sp. EKM208P]|nr:hypothetical protein H6F38_24385 [Paenibacillus sp. EKM208P]
MFLLWINISLILLFFIVYFTLSRLISKNLLADISILYRYRYFYFPFILIIINSFIFFLFEKDIKYYVLIIIYMTIPALVIIKQKFIDIQDDKISREIYDLTAPLILDALKQADITNYNQIIQVVVKKRNNKVDGEIIVKLPQQTSELERMKGSLQKEIRKKSYANIKLIFDYKFDSRKKKLNYSPVY